MVCGCRSRTATAGPTGAGARASGSTAREEGDLPLDTERVGFTGKLEQFLGGSREFRLGVSEPAQFGDREAGHRHQADRVGKVQRAGADQGGVLAEAVSGHHRRQRPLAFPPQPPDGDAGGQ